jgi:hypothetical protein
MEHGGNDHQANRAVAATLEGAWTWAGRHRSLLDARASPLLPPRRDLRVRGAHRARGTHAPTIWSRSAAGSAAGRCGGARALAALAGPARGAAGQVSGLGARRRCGATLVPPGLHRALVPDGPRALPALRYGAVDPVRELPYRLAALIIAAPETDRWQHPTSVSEHSKNHLRRRGPLIDRGEDHAFRKGRGCDRCCVHSSGNRCSCTVNSTPDDPDGRRQD